MADRIVVLPGDGIGPEVTQEARNILVAAAEKVGRKTLRKHALPLLPPPEAPPEPPEPAPDEDPGRVRKSVRIAVKVADG